MFRRKKMTIKDMMVASLVGKTNRSTSELRNMSKDELYRLWNRVHR